MCSSPWENAEELLGGLAQGAHAAAYGLVPIVYQANLKEPGTYFAVQHFRMRDGDVIYVSNSRAAELQRFLNLVSSSILPVATTAP